MALDREIEYVMNLSPIVLVADHPQMHNLVAPSVHHAKPLDTITTPIIP